MPGPTAPNSPASSGNLQTLINGRIDDVVAAMEKAQKYLQDIVNKKKKAPLQKTPPQSNIKRNAVKKTVRAVPKKNMKKDALL